MDVVKQTDRMGCNLVKKHAACWGVAVGIALMMMAGDAAGQSAGAPQGQPSGVTAENPAGRTGLSTAPAAASVEAQSAAAVSTAQGDGSAEGLPLFGSHFFAAAHEPAGAGSAGES